MRWLFLFLLLSSISFSIMSDYSMNVVVESSGATYFSSSITFVDAIDKEVTLCFSGELSNILVTDKSGFQIPFSIHQSNGFNCISFIVPYDYARISFESDDFTSKNGSLWDFHMRAFASENISSFNSQLTLPSGSTLQKTNGAVSSAGDSLKISWESQNINASQKLYLAAAYEITRVEGSNIQIVLAATIIVVAAAAYFFYLRKRRAKTEPKPLGTEIKKAVEAKESKTEEWLERNEVFRTLDEVDKEIVREIGRQNGKTTQAKIYLNTHIPKATLSRRLASLENRGIIKKSQKGNRNLITLALEKK